MHTRQEGLGFIAVAAAIAPATGPAAPAVLAVGLVASLVPFAWKAIGSIRAGANEADAIVPVQEEVGRILAAVDPQISRASVPRLQQLLDELLEMARFFLNFCAGEQFTDGRASTQALNALMPMIDGTGGYSWPELRGFPVTVDVWGLPTHGGRVGTVQRRILALGGRLGPPQLTTAGYLPTLAIIENGDPYVPQPGRASLDPNVVYAAGDDYAPPAARRVGSTVPLMLAAAAAAFALFAFGGRKRP